jgi:hypothetical protein
VSGVSRTVPDVGCQQVPRSGQKFFTSQEVNNGEKTKAAGKHSTG